MESRYLLTPVIGLIIHEDIKLLGLKAELVIVKISSRLNWETRQNTFINEYDIF